MSPKASRIGSIAMLACCVALSGCAWNRSGATAAAGSLLALNSSVAFGSVPVGNTATTNLTLVNQSAMPVDVSQLAVSGQGFNTVSPTSLPVTVNAGSTLNISLQFNPSAPGAATGQLTITSDSSSGATMQISLDGMGAPANTTALSSLSCTSTAVTGSAPDACEVTLSAVAPTGGLTVNLMSDNAAVTVPASVSVNAGATSADFTATVSAVSTIQTANLTASAAGATETFALQLGAMAAPTLVVSSANLTFGNVGVSDSAVQPVTLSSTGTAPVTVSAATLTGAGFTTSGASFPLTLNPGQTATLNVGFNPSAAGDSDGLLTLASNTSAGTLWLVRLHGTGMPKVSGLSCANGSFSGAGTDRCTVTLNAAAPSGGAAVNLASNSSSVTVPATVTVAAGANSASFTVTIASVSNSQTVTLTASAYGPTASFALVLGTQVPTLSSSSASLTFGNVAVNTATTQSITLTSKGSSAVTVSAAAVSGTGFSISGESFPLTLNPGQTATLSVQFYPVVSGTSMGNLTLTSNSSTGTSMAVSLSGTGMPGLSSLSCANGSMSGAGSDNCTVTLNAAATTGGFQVNLASNNSAVTVPASVTVPAGATSGTFTATVSSVSTATTVTLTASAGSVAQTFALQLGSTVPTLGLSVTSLSFGNVNVNTPTTQSLTLSSTGTGPLNVSAATVTGTGYTVSGATFPLTLNPNQTATLTVQFDPTAAGTGSGTLTLTSNSSKGTSTAVSLSGTGIPVPSGLSCTSGSMTAVGTDSCTVTLNAAAAAGGFQVNLASNSSAVSVPASVTIASGATSGSFTATVSSVSTAQTVTLTASAGSAARTFALQLGAGVPTLSISSTSLSFGSVTLSTPATQSVTLNSTGTASVTISGATVTGTGFTLAAASFPMTLSPNQTATLSMQFDPTSAGTASGQLTITSNSSTGSSAVIGLSGTGVATSYDVDLSWNAPTSSTDPVVGYNVYRSLSGSTSYQQLNSAVVTQTAYVDATAQTGQTYDYIVESVDASGSLSVPSNMAAAVVP